jgi:hypothetical protein
MIQPQRALPLPPPPEPPAPPSGSDATIAAAARAPSGSGQGSAWRSSLALLGDLGTLPRAAPGMGVRVGLGGARVEGALTAAFFPQSRAPAPGGPIDGKAAGGDFSLVSGAVEGCLVLAGRVISLCAGPGLERMTGAGFGVSAPRRGSKTWLTGAAALNAVLPLPRGWLAVARVGAVAPLFRERFVLDDIGVVHRPQAFAGRGGVGVGRAF